VLLKPASLGQGIIAGGAVRSVVDLLGVKDIVSKSLGASNPLNVARVTVKALQMLKAPRVPKAPKDEKAEATVGAAA
jgi:small subunit ribosomal protein S5